MAKAKLTDIERDLVQGLQEFRDDLKEGSVAQKYTCHRVAIDLMPQPYSAEDVKTVREFLNVSQAIFAKFLGVSPKTVQAWEQGKAPSDMARRFMDEIRHDPDYWRRRLAESTKVVTND